MLIDVILCHAHSCEDLVVVLEDLGRPIELPQTCVRKVLVKHRMI